MAALRAGRNVPFTWLPSRTACRCRRLGRPGASATAMRPPTDRRHLSVRHGRDARVIRERAGHPAPHAERGHGPARPAGMPPSAARRDLPLLRGSTRPALSSRHSLNTSACDCSSSRIRRPADERDGRPRARRPVSRRRPTHRAALGRHRRVALVKRRSAFADETLRLSTNAIAGSGIARPGRVAGLMWPTIGALRCADSERRASPS